MNWKFWKKTPKNIVTKKKPGKMSSYVIPKEIITSYCFAGVSLVSVIAVSIHSAVKRGNAGIVVGVIPFIALILNITGLILAYRNLKNESVKLKHVYIGLISNGLLVFFYLVLYVVGFLV